MKPISSFFNLRLVTHALALGLGIALTAWLASTKGITTWNDEAVTEYSEKGVVSHALKLHLQVVIDDEKQLQDYVDALANSNSTQVKSAIVGILRQHPFDYRDDVIALYNSNAVNYWSFRVFFDGNETSPFGGYFIELEFKQPITKEQRDFAHRYIVKRADDADKAALKALVTDDAAAAILGLK